MVLATRCPHCETVFRLQEAMLAGSGGFARCGHCHQVFDARSNLLDPHAGEPQAAGEPAPIPAAGDAGSDARLHEEDRERAPTEEARAEEPIETGAEAEAGAETESDPIAEPPADEPASQQPTLPEPPLSPEPEFVPEPPLSAEVPPLVAPVFEPHVEPVREAEVPTPEPKDALPEQTPERPLEHEAQPQPQTEVEPLPIPLDEPTADHEETGPIERAHGEDVHATVQPTWSQYDPHWRDDDEPHFNSPAPSNGAEPHFGAAPSQPPSQAPDEVDSEPHLDPHLRERLQARADEDERGEPPFATAAAAAADEPRMRAAGVPPIFAEPPASGEHERHFAVTREARAKSPGRVVGYIVGSLIALALIVVLIAQLAWWRREAVMVYWPDSQPLFARACERLGCRLTPPRDIDGLQVEASDLRQVDGPHRLELRVPLRNRYGIALAYPAIELTLFDNKNNVAIRRILWPQDYLPPGMPAAAGLPAHATQTMVVRLDSGNAIATNFRVQIFYP